MSDLEQRPVKRARVVGKLTTLEDCFNANPKSRAQEPSASPKIPTSTPNLTSSATLPDAPVQADDELAVGQPSLAADIPGFDSASFLAIAGDVPHSTVQVLARVSKGNLERAINMYFDGSWKAAASQAATNGASAQPIAGSKRKSPFDIPSTNGTSAVPAPQLGSMPPKRYIGAFGVEAYTTRSGTNLVQWNESVRIDRQKLTLNPKAKTTGKTRKTQDIVVRFFNDKGVEVGRLPQESASFVSTLIDQHICSFEGTVVYAPEKVRTNDTIHLQLRCYLLRRSFDKDIRPAEDNRKAEFFDKETDDEKALRLRQVALVKVFEKINLQPSSTNAPAGHKNDRSALIKAAETPDQNDASSAAKLLEKDKDKEPTGEDSEEGEGEKLEQEQLDALYSKAQAFDFNSPEAEPVDTFTMTLRGYQKQALHWMINKEKDISDREGESMHPLWEEYIWPTRDENDKDLPGVDGVDKFYVNPYSGELSLKFPRQDGRHRGGILADEMGLGKTIEMLALIHSNKSEVKLASKPKKVKSIDGIDQAPHTTLVIAPMSLIDQWRLEAQAASKPGSLKSMVYYGDEKKAGLRNMCNQSSLKEPPGIVITSYGTVLSELSQLTRAGGNRANHDGLFSLNFYRIILDEGHHIKNRSSKTARACYELAADHRWVLTGTPIVNRLEDLFSLVRFLRVEPWRTWAFWKTFITTPFENREFLRALDVVQTVLEPLVLRRTKDMKLPNGQPLVPLPPKTINIEKIRLGDAEREVYNFISQRLKKSFVQNLEAGTLMKSYTSIFAQILRLRQSCCHPTLVRKKEVVADELEAQAAYDAATGLSDDMDLNDLIDKFSGEEEEQKANVFGANALKEIRSQAEAECPFCLTEPMEEQVVTGCFHAACKSCLLDYLDRQQKDCKPPTCITCRTLINRRDLFAVLSHPDPPSGTSTPTTFTLRRLVSHSSAKIDALISNLKAVRAVEPATKSCVFSQFTSFIDLIEPVLNREKIPHLRFDGSMSQPARAAVLDKFRSHEGCMVLLISLRAGGVGLNLTEASRVFMLDPWWAFSVEAQAIDRVHRMGQTKPVVVTRFVVENSVEERMVERIQAKKMFLASSLGMMGEEEKRAQRIEDIKTLLSEEMGM